jgi:hypothetical protein
MMPMVCAVCGDTLEVMTFYRHKSGRSAISYLDAIDYKDQLIAERFDHVAVPMRSTPIHALCAGCGHSESSHNSRVESRARGNDVGSKGGVYRCQHCPCLAWQEPSRLNTQTSASGRERPDGGESERNK